MGSSIRPLALALALALPPFAAAQPSADAGAWATPAATDARADAGGSRKAKTLDAVRVVGHRDNVVGSAISASEGSVSREEIAARAINRTGDLLEFVPGLVVTQHSGSGKANQYFLRGFNLDHGTDFATFVDGMPVNLRTHAHGQGYSDLNFLIPETVEAMTYRKGPYYADVGDFSSAGTARFQLSDTVEKGFGELTAGSFGYARGLVLDVTSAGAGQLFYAGEVQTYDGPWTNVREDVGKASALLRYSQPAGGGQAHLTFMGYRNSWNAADQIPQRAVDAGLIDAFGQLDPTDGGRTSRYSLSGGWRGPLLGGTLDANAYAIDYHLRLWSDFTYFLDNPVGGDQFEQVDAREVYGFSLAQQWNAGRSRWLAGAEGRYDGIGEVGLFHTTARQVTGTVRDDAVREGSIGLYVANEFHFTDTLRSYVGARWDDYRFHVDSSLPVNSGNADANRFSWKASLAWRPVRPAELYASYGTGFHSNDARGTTIRVDPNTGDPAQPVTPLVGSRGGELGGRLYLGGRLQATLSVWSLKLDSELLFTGDGGTTEASRPSQRNGGEFGLYWFGSDHVKADVEVSYTNAYFTDRDPAGPRIPGAIPLVISAGLSAKSDHGWVASARLRHFGKYPLIEDDSVRSKGSTLVNLRVGKEWERTGLYLDVLNALDSRDHDIDYYFASRLPGEPAGGADDVHFHVFEPRSFRLSLRVAFP